MGFEDPSYGVVVRSFIFGERLVYVSSSRAAALARARAAGKRATVVRIYPRDNRSNFSPR